MTEEYCPMHPYKYMPCTICHGMDEYAPVNDYEGAQFCSEDDAREYVGIFNKTVTGSDNPHYDFSRPVSGLQELIDVLDPDMPHYRYRLIKLCIRWADKTDLEYTLEAAIFTLQNKLRNLREVSEDKGGR